MVVKVGEERYRIVEKASSCVVRRERHRSLLLHLNYRQKESEMGWRRNADRWRIQKRRSM